jgi:hypothetical protein
MFTVGKIKRIMLIKIAPKINTEFKLTLMRDVGILNTDA